MNTKGLLFRSLKFAGKPLRLIMVMAMVFSTLSLNLMPVSAEGDIEPPAAPLGLTALGADQQVELAWEANAEEDLAGYNLYRSEVTPVEAGGSPVNGADLISGEAYTDAGLANGTTYYYAVTAVDASGNESALSAEVSAAPQVEEPAPAEEPPAEPTEEPTLEPTEAPVVKSPSVTALGSEVGIEALAAWTAYNDLVTGSPQPANPANTTTYTISGSTSGLLKDLLPVQIHLLR